MNRILIKDCQEIYISTDPNEVKKETEKHYAKTFATRNSNFDLLSEDWKEKYRSKDNIKNKWYESLMESISEKKVNVNHKDFPNDKAYDMSGISYKMLKKLEAKEKKVLREFFSLCLIHESCSAS